MTLVWSPIIDHVRQLAQDAGGMRVLISPFASVQGTERLLQGMEYSSDLKMVCRWSAQDIASGIADLGIYPLLRERGIPLFLHSRIHLKLYVFADNTAFHSSANATGKGMGLVHDHNIEVGAVATLTRNDWDKLYHLFDASVLVDDLVYARALQYQKDHARAIPSPLPPLDLAPPPADSTYSIAALPACPDPDTFARWHLEPEAIPPTEFSSYAHDRNLYGVPTGISRDRCLAFLGLKFRNHPFIQDLVRLIRSHGTAPFGKVKAWLQSTCRDTPVPYRWELTRNTRVLYDWLSYFYDEISWDRPQHSMVIRWTPPS